MPKYPDTNTITLPKDFNVKLMRKYVMETDEDMTFETEKGDKVTIPAGTKFNLYEEYIPANSEGLGQ